MQTQLELAYTDGLELPFGVVPSPRSIKSRWVQKELETAMSKEIETGSVVVLPLLYEKCELPPFLHGKLYADFTSPEAFESLWKSC